METGYDYITVLIFVVIVLTFLQFSRQSDQQILPYIYPSIGCAVGNYLGNAGVEQGNMVMELSAWSVIIATVGFVFLKIIRKGGAPDEDI